MPALDIFTHTQDHQYVLLVVRPIISPVDEARLRQLLLQSPYGRYRLSEEGLQEAVKALNETITHPECRAALASSKIVLGQRLDAQFSLTLAEDRMSAEATLVAAYGGEPLTRAALDAALAQAGICRGLDDGGLNALLAQMAQAEPGRRFTWVLAQGQPPQAGQDTRFEAKVQTRRELMPQQREGQLGKVDLRNLGQIATVRQGDLLMVRHPFTPGIPGFTVTGEVLPAEPGKDAEFNPGEGTGLDPANPNQLLASREGLPIALERGMQVDEVLVIQTVDARYGHVNFSGSVMIGGNVCDGMRVQAGGEIQVAGFVESATLQAGGDVVVGRGIIGHQQQVGSHVSSCVIRAKGCIRARFAQYAELHSGQDVQIESQLIHSQVTAVGSVRVQDQGGRKGTLVGGRIEAGVQIEAVILGAHADNSTQLVIDGLFGPLKRQQKAIQMQIIDTQEVIRQVEEAHGKLLMMPPSAKKDELAVKLASTLQHHHQQLAQHESQLEANKGELEAFLAQARVLARHKLYGGLHVEIAGKRLVTQNESGPSQIGYVEGKLALGPL